MSAYKNHLEEAIAVLELNTQVMSVPPSVLKRTREAVSLLRSHAIEFNERSNNYIACKKCLAICYDLKHLREHKCSG